MCQHHWYIDSQGQGKCVKCPAIKDFTEDMDKADGLNANYYLNRISNYKKGISTGHSKEHFDLWQQGGLHPNIKIFDFVP